MAWLRQYENREYKCPRCGGRTCKEGKKGAKQKRQCQECGMNYTVGVVYNFESNK